MLLDGGDPFGVTVGRNFGSLPSFGKGCFQSLTGSNVALASQECPIVGMTFETTGFWEQMCVRWQLCHGWVDKHVRVGL